MLTPPEPENLNNMVMIWIIIRVIQVGGSNINRYGVEEIKNYQELKSENQDCKSLNCDSNQ